MKVTTISPKDALQLLERYTLELGKKEIVQRREEEKRVVVLINRVTAFFLIDEVAFPTLRFLMTHPTLLKKITVDMGAVKFIINGADVMRPGIHHIEEGIVAGSPIAIVDQTHGKFLAVGITLLGSEEMRNASSGKVIKNLHYVGDELWKEEA